MKKSVLLAVSVAFFLSACKHSTSPKSGSSGGPITATVNGQSWTALFGSSSHKSGYIVFGGANNTGEIDIQVVSTVTDTGTYPIDDTDVGASFTQYSSPQVEFDAIPHSGTIHFTALTSTHVAGTFNFIGKSPAGAMDTIANGSFNETY